MATIDLTRKNGYNKKKVVRISAAEFLATDIPLAANVYTLFNLPPDALIVQAYADVIEGSTETAALSIKAGATEIVAVADSSATGITAGDPDPLKTDTGLAVTIATDTDLDTGDGKFNVIVEYIEYELNNGELTNYTENV